MNPLRIALLGSTGSIGTSTLRAVRALKGRVRVELLAAQGTKPELLAAQAAEFHPSCVAVTDKAKAAEVKTLLPKECRFLSGMDELCSALRSADIDLVLCAIAGSPGLPPVIAALQAGKRLALATKEALVMAGHYVTELAAQNGVKIFPVDSEHSAVFQCLEGHPASQIKELVLTASGGPFRNKTRAEMDKMTWADALKHPTWSMGPKVSVDSASLMNKALEIVEARWLFDMEADRIGVVIHPQSIVHSMIRFQDGVLLAQMSVPDMIFPIQYALTWPDRISSGLPDLDLAAVGSLTFEEASETRFPALGFARSALRSGRTFPLAMNAANDIALERFRAGEIPFTGIWKIVEKTLEAHEPLNDLDLEEIQEADRRARAYARTVQVQENLFTLG